MRSEIGAPHQFEIHSTHACGTVSSVPPFSSARCMVRRWRATRTRRVASSTTAFESWTQTAMVRVKRKGRTGQCVKTTLPTSPHHLSPILSDLCA